MIAPWRYLAAGLFVLAACGLAWAQEPAAPDDAAATTTEETATTEEAPAPAARDRVDSIEDVAERVDQSPEAQQARAGLLKPIYALAEKLAVPGFHWAAFALMTAGVVSFALQLVLGKLVVLTRMSLSPSEILSDALGLAVSLIGLVLTTQAATENSNFTQSAFAVLTSAALGVVAGLVFYLWGQRQELQAAEGRRAARARQAQSPPPAKPSA